MTSDLPYEPVDRDRQAERARAEKLPGYTEARKMTPEIADMLRARERLMEEIESYVDEYFQAQIKECGELGELSNFYEAKEALIRDLCDAVCKNFPLTMEENV